MTLPTPTEPDGNLSQPVRENRRRRRSGSIPWWVNLRIKSKGLLVVTLPVVILVAVMMIRAPFLRQQQETAALLSRDADIRDAAQELILVLLDIETITQRFALSGDGDSLQLFELSAAKLAPAIGKLDGLVDGSERAIFEQASSLARLRLQHAASMMKAFKAGETVATPTAAAAMADGRRVMNEFRQVVGTLLDAKHVQVEQSQVELRRTRQRLAPVVLITFFGGLVGALAAAWLFATGIAARVAGLERNAERLAAGRALRYEPSRGGDEIGSLDKTLRRASVGLRARDRELRTLNRSLEHALHEQMLLNRELEAFSYSVSHDLRAPLRSIDGFAQALREDWGDRLDDAGQDHLSRIRNAAQRMGRLIDDLLKLARLTRLPVERAKTDLTQFAREIAGDLEARNPARRVTWEIEDGLEAYCDASLVHAVLENLLGNAWKFTSKTENARIEFRAVPNTLPMQYVIRDNGAGFDMKYMDKLFGPFQRLHSEREFPGTGIGLATVQRIVHKHGGEVRTESQVGQGATFSFTLEPDDVGAVDTRITRAAEGTRRSSSRRIRAAQPQATERTA